MHARLLNCKLKREREREKRKWNGPFVRRHLIEVLTSNRRRSHHEGNICVVRTTHVAVPERACGCGSSTCSHTIDIGDGIE